MAPLPTRLFTGIDVVERMARLRGGRMTSDAESRLLSVEVGKKVFSVSYVRKALSQCRVLSLDTVERFNGKPVGVRAIAEAKEELYRQLHTYGPYHHADHPHLATVRLVATTFYTDARTVIDWCNKGLVPCVSVGDRYYFEPTELYWHFVWSQ